jgi:hypothetical protein
MMNFLAPQSRFVLKTFFKRNYDVLSETGKQTVNRVMLASDVVLVLGLYFLL